MLPFRLACRRLRPKFNKSPLDIMMGMIVFVLFRSVSGSEETVGTVLQANKQVVLVLYTPAFWFQVPSFKKSLHSL